MKWLWRQTGSGAEVWEIVLECDKLMTTKAERAQVVAQGWSTCLACV